MTNAKDGDTLTLDDGTDLTFQLANSPDLTDEQLKILTESAQNLATEIRLGIASGQMELPVGSLQKKVQFISDFVRAAISEQRLNQDRDKVNVYPDEAQLSTAITLLLNENIAWAPES